MVKNSPFFGRHAFGVTSSRLLRDKFGFSARFSKNFSHKGTKSPSGWRSCESAFAHLASLARDGCRIFPGQRPGLQPNHHLFASLRIDPDANSDPCLAQSGCKVANRDKRILSRQIRIIRQICP